MNTKNFLLWSFLSLSAPMTPGCGAAYQASEGTHFAADSAREINDDEVRAAFEASPQVKETSKVAYYTFDESRSADIEKMLATTHHVTSVYKIPRLLVTGQRTFQDGSLGAQSGEVSLKKLRLLAARAHADVLVVFDHGYRGGGANPLVALNVLLVPALFTPWLSNETESYAQALVFDVRNGYLYADFTTTDKGGQHYVTIYGKAPADVADDQWPKLLTDVKAKVSSALAPPTSGETTPPVVASSKR